MIFVYGIADHFSLPFETNPASQRFPIVNLVHTVSKDILFQMIG